MALQTKGFSWFSTNLALNIVLLVGGLFAISERESAQAVAAAISLASFIGVVREAVKAGPRWREWLASSNTWTYIASIVTVFLPTLPVELFDLLGQFIASIIGQNYQGAVLAAFALINIVYRLITTPKPSKDEPRPQAEAPKS